MVNKQKHIYKIKGDGTTIDLFATKLKTLIENFYQDEFNEDFYILGHKGPVDYGVVDRTGQNMLPCKIYTNLNGDKFGFEKTLNTISLSPFLPELWPESNARVKNIELVKRNILKAFMLST